MSIASPRGVFGLCWSSTHGIALRKVGPVAVFALAASAPARDRARAVAATDALAPPGALAALRVFFGLFYLFVRGGRACESVVV